MAQEHEQRGRAPGEITLSMGGYRSAVESAVDALARNRTIERIWRRDHTVWKPSPDGISNRLGWLDVAGRMGAEFPRIEALVGSARTAGYRRALLLGMGGSSLAPEVFRKTFGVAGGCLDLSVLDSTDPGALLALDDGLDPSRTLFIVSTKSGGTVETLSFFSHFYNRVAGSVGRERAGEHFIAITDPGSRLEEIAAELRFRETFLNDPDIGGRFSALSLFGLVPAALIGADPGLLRQRALSMAALCGPSRPVAENPGALLGAAIGSLAREGRDKLTFVLSPGIAGFGDWVEQLIAESTGKDGRGILPVVGEAPAPPSLYGNDRVFVFLALEGDASHETAAGEFQSTGHPVIRLSMNDRYDLASQMFLWEMATAVAGSVLGINPFDQPNVEAAKVSARGVVAEYREKGALPSETPFFSRDGISVYAPENLFEGDHARDIPASGLLKEFLDPARPGDYVSLQAYVAPTPGNRAALESLRSWIRDRTGLATTLGFGPRYLHSTGQLHKGDAGRGQFIQITTDPVRDLPIPDGPGIPESHMTFGVLEAAQAIGDRKALEEAGRRVVRFHLGGDVRNGTIAMRTRAP